MKIYEKDGTVRLNVYVQPRASKTEIVGVHGDAVKIRLAAPPVDGAANDELVRFLAKQLGVAQSNIEIVGGMTSRNKTVAIHGVPLADVQKMI